MGNRLIVAISLGLALATAACGDDDGKNGSKPDGATAPDGGPLPDSGAPGIDSGMDATTPGPDGTIIGADGNIIVPEGGQGGGDTSMPQPGSVTKRITSAGGSVTSADGNLVLTFSPGILQRPVNVTIRQVTTMLPMGARGGVSYEISPIWETFTNVTDQRKVIAALKYNAAILGTDRPGDLPFGRFEGGGWIELTNAQPYIEGGATFIRGELTKLGTIGFFTGICEACATSCNPETCKVGDQMQFPGKCMVRSGCNVCVPLCDEDGDGFCRTDGSGSRGLDCDPADPSRNPEAPELCNGVDDNCNNSVDEGCKACKLDAECGTGSWCEQGTCRPCNFGCSPGAACSFGFEPSFPGRCQVRSETCSLCVPSCDADGDLFCPAGSPAVGQDVNSPDCADDKPNVNSRAIEECGDMIDNDCDGKVDNGCRECDNDSVCPANTYCNANTCTACTTTCTPETCTTGVCADYGNGCKRCKLECDGDNDGYCRGSGQGDYPGGDGADDDRNIYPGAAEICGNNKDDDLDGFTDEGCRACAADAECGSSEFCANGVCLACDTRWDPTQRFGGSDTNPDAGVAAVKLSYGRGCEKGIPACDKDRDGFCDPNMPGGIRDDQILGWDCDDTDPKINRASIEVCGNGKDDDCDGQADENCGICTEAAMCGAGNRCSSGR